MRVYVGLGAFVLLSWLLEGLTWVRIGFGLWRHEPTWCLAVLLIVAAFIAVVGAATWEMLVRRVWR